MKYLSLLWVGEDIHATEPEYSIGSLRRPHRISMGDVDKIVLGGLKNPQSNYIHIQSRLSKSIISPNHASVGRHFDAFVISDHSETGTYVNNVRILKATSLSDGDVICFGNKGGESIEPGSSVQKVKSDLKYKVLIESDFQAPLSNNRRLFPYYQSNLACIQETSMEPALDIIDLTEMDNSNYANNEVDYSGHKPSNDDNLPVKRKNVPVSEDTSYQNKVDNHSSPMDEEINKIEPSKNSNRLMISEKCESIVKLKKNERRKFSSNPRTNFTPVFKSPVFGNKNDDLTKINGGELLTPLSPSKRKQRRASLNKLHGTKLTPLKSGLKPHRTRKKNSLSRVTSVKSSFPPDEDISNSEQKEKWSSPDEVSQNNVEIYEYAYCSSKACLMPRNDRIEWIFCDFCKKWYHQVCVRLKVVPKGKYKCPSCSRK